MVPTLLRKTKARPRALCQEKRKDERSAKAGVFQKETAREAVKMTQTGRYKSREVNPDQAKETEFAMPYPQSY